MANTFCRVPIGTGPAGRGTSPASAGARQAAKITAIQHARNILVFPLLAGRCPKDHGRESACWHSEGTLGVRTALATTSGIGCATRNA